MKRAEATKGESVMKGLIYSARYTVQEQLLVISLNMVNVQRVNYNIHADVAQQWNLN